MSSTRPTSRRRASRMSGDDREDAVLDSLRELLRTRSWSDMSIADITAGAGISRPTFYFYFASKDAALLALYDAVVESTESAYVTATELLTEDPQRAWRTALASIHDIWEAHREVMAAASAARLTDPAIAKRWTGLVERFVDRTALAIEHERARGAAPDGLDARDLAVCLNLMTERVLLSQLGDEPVTVAEEQSLDTLTSLWLSAIYGVVTTPPART